MRHGYMQFELDPESRPITTFYTHRGLRRSKRLSFGINSAAEVFHEEIHQTLSDIPNVSNIYDDIIVYGKTQEEHNIALCRALQHLQDCGLTLNKDKCILDKSRIQFFGVIFSKEGLSPAPDKIEALMHATQPTNAAEVRSFLGMTNFSSYFIPEYSVMTAPLRALTTKNAKFTWNIQCQEAFDKLRTALRSEPVMAYFDPERKTKVTVDGSKKTGVSSILTQEDPVTKQYQVVRYDSRPTTAPEQRYSQIEIESAAIEFGMLRNHIYLYGLPKFTIATDHKPLLPLYNTYKKDPPARVLKNKLRLQGYNYNLIFEPGASNAADYLSRHPPTHSKANSSTVETELLVDAIVTAHTPDAITLQELKKHTAEDPQLIALAEAIVRGYISKAGSTLLSPFSQIFQELSIYNGIILRGTAVVIPATLQSKAIQLAHEGHQGLVKTKQYARAHMWFPRMDTQLTKMVTECHPCQAATNTKQQEPLKMTTLPEAPWTNLRADLFGPLPNTQHILVVQCLYSRYPAVEIVSSTSAAAVIPALERILTDFGIPYKLGTDNGPPFNSHQFRKFAAQLGFEHTRVTPYAPWANGTIEHFMRNLGKVLKTANVMNSNWKTELHGFLRAYRATPHSTTGFAPAHLMFNGRTYSTRIPTVHNTKELTDHDTVKANDLMRKEEMKRKADRKAYVKVIAIKEGDQVLCRQKMTNKTMTPYDPCPYRVTSIRGSQVTATNDNRTITRHITFFKKLKTPAETPKAMVQKAVQQSRQPEVATDSEEEEVNSEVESDATTPYEEEVHSELESDTTIPYEENARGNIRRTTRSATAKNETTTV